MGKEWPYPYATASTPGPDDYVTFTGTATVGPTAEQDRILDAIANDPPAFSYGDDVPICTRETWFKIGGTIGAFVYGAAVYLFASTVL